MPFLNILVRLYNQSLFEFTKYAEATDTRQWQFFFNLPSNSPALNSLCGVECLSNYNCGFTRSLNTRLIFVLTLHVGSTT